MLALISQLGICMLTCIFLCVFLGDFLARTFQQELIFPLMLVIGILAGPNPSEVTAGLPSRAVTATAASSTTWSRWERRPVVSVSTTKMVS